MVARIRIGGITAPAPPSITQRSEAVAYPVPKVDSAQSGLEGLSQALSNFFSGAGNALDTLAQAHHAVTMAEIKQENTDQATRGAADALRSHALSDMDEHLRGDRDYYDAFSKTLAAKNGSELANQFVLELAQKPVDTTDPKAELEAFLKKNLQNGDGIGTGDPLFDAVMLDSVYRGVDQAMNTFAVNQVKYQIQQGKDNLFAYIGNNWKYIDNGAQLSLLFDRARTLYADDPSQAVPAVMNALVSAAGSAPKEGQRLLNLLNEKGSGDKERSYREMFPESYNEVDAKLAGAFKSAITVEGQQAYDGVEKMIQTAASGDDLNAALATLDSVAERYGEQSRADSLRNVLMTKLTKYGEQVTTMNQILGMANGTRDYDANVLTNEHIDTFVSNYIGNWYEHPDQVAQMLEGFRLKTSESLKREFDSALGNPRDIQKFGASLAIFRQLQTKYGDAALAVLGKEAATNFLYADDLMTYMRMDPAAAAKTLVENRKGLEKSDSITWKALTGAKDEMDAKASVQDQIRSSIQKAVDNDDVVVSESVMNDIMSMVKINAIAHNEHGSTDINKAIDVAVRVAATKGMSLVPGRDGKVMITPTRMPTERPSIREDGSLVIGDDGKVKMEQTVPFGKVLNPDTNETEDTIDTWRNDADQLARSLSGIPQLSDGSTLTLSGNTDKAAWGVWLVMDEASTEPVVLGFGKTYTIAGKEVTIPEKEAEAYAFLRDLKLVGDDGRSGLETSANGRFVIIPYPGETSETNPDGPYGLVIGYRPGFRYKKPSIEQKAQEVQDRLDEANRNAEIEAEIRQQNREADIQLWDSATGARHDR